MTPVADGGARKPRADALRNRARLLSVAKDCFADPERVYGMEEIAGRAGVGVGTLYRAFGSRVGLAEAVFRDMIDRLVAEASTLEADPCPAASVRKWITAYVDQMISKRAIIRELQPAFDADPGLAEDAHRLAARTLGALLDRAQTVGAIRADLSSTDLLPIINGMVRAWPNDRARVHRVLDVFLNGLGRQTG